MSSPAPLRRPEHLEGVKRITSLFSPPKTDSRRLNNSSPPTPPLDPKSRATSYHFGHHHPPPPPPVMPADLTLPSPSPSVSSFGGSSRDRYTPGFQSRQYAGHGGSLNARHAHTPTSAVFGDNGEILQAPVAPFAMGSRPSSRSSMGGWSRPGTSSGNSLAPGPAKPIEVTRLRKENKMKKANGEMLQCWRLVPTGTKTTDLQEFDYSPLIRGEPDDSLWFADGDTLVYLDEKDNPNPKYSMPSFRIRSSYLMHTTLKNCIENVPLVGEPRSGPPSRQGSSRHPQDLFFSHGDNASTNNGTAASSGTSSPLQRHSRDSLGGPGDEVYTSANASRVASPAPMSGKQSPEPGIMFKVYFPILQNLDKPQTMSVLSPKDAAKQAKIAADHALQQFVDVRNLFAFLTLSFLVATPVVDSAYTVFNRIYDQLSLHSCDIARLQAAENHLNHYIDELRLDDVRNDDESILDAIIMGERWQSQRLYQEGFLHAVGRWDALQTNPAIEMVDRLTRQSLDRASLDLNIRLKNVQNRLTDFTFPAVWIGEGRAPECKPWKAGYEKMRTLVINHMKHTFGSWPPRAGKRGKGNGFTETGGLNRVVLQTLYSDLCCVYDLLVDRDWCHGEKIDRTGGRSGITTPAESGTRSNSRASDKPETPEDPKDVRGREILLKMLKEFDTSYVPVQPDMPFNLPRIPSRTLSGTKPKKRLFFSRSDPKVHGNEIDALVSSSYNPDAREEHAQNPFVKAFIAMERDFGSGKSVKDFADARRGRWVFLYCVLQSLPLTVVDAIGLRYGDGVEYFLCENMKDGYSWDKGILKRQTRMTGLWNEGMMAFGPGSSQLNLISNPDDDVDITYRRSHCWMVSEDWRLVHDSEAEDESYPDSDDPIGFDSEGRPIFPGESEYIAGMNFPSSPSIHQYPPPQDHLYNHHHQQQMDFEASNDTFLADQPQPLAYRPGPGDQVDGAPGPSPRGNNRTSHYSQPSVEVYDFQTRPRITSTETAAGIPLPQTPQDSPYRLAPFNFDIDRSTTSLAENLPVVEREPKGGPPNIPLPPNPPPNHPPPPPPNARKDMGLGLGVPEEDRRRDFSNVSVASDVPPMMAIRPERMKRESLPRLRTGNDESELGMAV